MEFNLGFKGLTVEIYSPSAIVITCHPKYESSK